MHDMVADRFLGQPCQISTGIDMAPAQQAGSGITSTTAVQLAMASAAIHQQQQQLDYATAMHHQVRQRALHAARTVLYFQLVYFAMRIEH